MNLLQQTSWILNHVDESELSRILDDLGKSELERLGKALSQGSVRRDPLETTDGSRAAVKPPR